jgi:hypothetical protein
VGLRIASAIHEARARAIAHALGLVEIVALDAT